jgi:hypothetical protein
LVVGHGAGHPAEQLTPVLHQDCSTTNKYNKQVCFRPQKFYSMQFGFGHVPLVS